jgi:hypothetical protein
MFWNKKDYVKRFDHEMVIAEIAKMIGGEHRVDGWLKIPGDKRITNTELANKLDLILDHLKLKYVPETKEPAKLVETPKYTGDSFEWTGCGWIVSEAPTKPKKKRGRPKKK